MRLKDIESRKDIFILVDTFYQKVREDDMLAPIFNQLVEDWDSHIQTITNFWETILFSSATYNGNPVAVHITVDRAIGRSLTQNHFNRWLELWYQTIKFMYAGEKTEMVKQRAGNMANIMFIKLYQARDQL